MFNFTEENWMNSWQCKGSGKYVWADEYCDGVKNCEDGSDEPPSCGKTVAV